MSPRWLAVVALLGCIDDPSPTREADPQDGAVPQDALAHDFEDRVDGQPPDATLDAASEPPDAAILRDAQPPDAAPPTCAVRTHPTTGFDRQEPLGTGPFYFHQDGQVQTLRAGQPTPLAPGTLVATGGGGVLIRSPEGTLQHLVGDRLHDLAEDFPDNPIAQPHAAVWGDHAAWWSEETLHQAVAGRAGPEVQLAVPGALSVTPGGVFLARHLDGAAELARVEGGAQVVAQGTTLHSLAPAQDALYFIVDGTVGRLDYDSGEVEHIARECQSVVAGGTRAAMVCSGPELANVLYLYDGRIQRIQAQGGVIGAVAVSETHLAWTSYAQPDAWCASFEPGRLLVTHDVLSRVHELATVNSGCLCCGAYWPMGHLALGDGVAWNYAGERGAPRVGHLDCLP